MKERVPLQPPPEWVYGAHRWPPPNGRNVILPVLRGPILARTDLMTNWHRPRWGTIDTARPWIGLTFTAWCSYKIPTERWSRRRQFQLLTADQVKPGEHLCRTCEGNAVDAGLPRTKGVPHLVIYLAVER